LVSRVDLLSGAYYVALPAATLAASGTLPGRAGSLVLLFFILVYPAIWAFSIRSALAVRVYRNQAFAVGLFPLGLYLGLVVGALGLSLSVVFAFYLVDSSALAGRRSDPLLRDTLHWRSVRAPLWVLLVLLNSGQVADLLVRGEYFVSRTPNDLVANVNFLLVIVILLLGVPLLAAVAKRSMDPALRRNLAWFGLALLMTFVSPVLAGDVPGGWGALVGFSLLGFFLYKSARSLAPLNALPRG
jgi:hypothetical protein